MFKSKRPHTIHLSKVPQKPSYGIFHDSLPVAAPGPNSEAQVTH